MRAANRTRFAGQLDMPVLSDATLQAWQRTAVETAPEALPPNTSESDGRWLWVIALAFLFLETMVRRSHDAVRDRENVLDDRPDDDVLRGGPDEVHRVA
jgi:hypothetical protein